MPDRGAADVLCCVSDLLQKPVEDLLMNQSNRFRETQEQKELISRGLPALHYGHVIIKKFLLYNIPTRSQVHDGSFVPFRVYRLYQGSPV